MIISDRKRLEAEIAQVKQLLSELPGDAVIGRLSLKSRIDELTKELEAIPHTSEPATAKLTFRGRPVVGSKGIFADFANRATTAFTELVTVLAASQSGPVASNGPIPNRDETQLLITGTAIGSFGFELQENLAQGSLGGIESPVAHAIQQSAELFFSVVEDSDEVLTDRISELDKRAVKDFREFLNVLKNNEAVCVLSYRDRQFGFRDVAQVQNAIDRIAEENMHESTVKFYGHFTGVLPGRRNFEFLTEPEGKLISGKIGPEVQEPEQIIDHLKMPTQVSFRAFRMGNGRARYVLEQLPNWS